MIVIVVLSAAVLLFALYVVHQGWKSARNIFDWQTTSNEETLLYGLENDEFPRELADMAKEDFLVPSPGGYDISGFLIPGSVPRTVVFSLGVTTNRWGMMKYVPLFLRAGWNVVLYDHRKHGDSGGRTISYGVFEKADMKAVIDFALERFPDTELLGLYGESMGAAISLQYAPTDDRVRFVVADCPFDDLYDELRHRSRDFTVPSFLKTTILALTVLFTRWAAGYDIRSVRPGRDILDTDIPVLFCHGDEDDYVPTVMSVRMYETRKDRAPTDLALYAGSEHARSIGDHREAYEARLVGWFRERLGVVLEG